MFRTRDPQSDLFETTNLLPAEKRARLGRTWAEVFREHALPLIEEEPFAPLFDDANGRPNSPVQVVIAVLILKEMFNLTDEEALEQLEFNLQWQHALRLTPAAHLCQKTLHNFRERLMRHDGARLAFERITAAIIKVLGIKVGRQRLDSTHIVSNFATLTRLGLFCETLRVALAALRKEHPRLFAKLPEELRNRYLKDDGTETRYRDAKSEVARRRLDVCARDVYRVLQFCEGKSAAKLREIGLLQQLFEDQCEVVTGKRAPSADDDDAGEGGAPVVVKEPETISSRSLQTPHDPDVTYSGHKGKGYEAQIAETCHEENEVEIITYVATTPSCESDDKATLPAVKDLNQRDLQPGELVVDTQYGSAKNAVEAAKLGTEIVSPVGGTAPQSSSVEFEQRPFTSTDFIVDAKLGSPARCPAGQEATAQRFVPNSNVVKLVFDADKCASCPLAARCPAKTKDGQSVVKVNLETANIERRRRAEASGEFRKRYDIRAGIEATNSELKRSHGLGRLRVRGDAQVSLAVYFKALACNVKRMLHALLRRVQLAGVAA
jgi:Transposase DDE domain/Transposase domain (DUF772)